MSTMFRWWGFCELNLIKTRPHRGEEDRGLTTEADRRRFGRYAGRSDGDAGGQSPAVSRVSAGRSGRPRSQLLCPYDGGRLPTDEHLHGSGPEQQRRSGDGNEPQPRWGRLVQRNCLAAFHTHTAAHHAGKGASTAFDRVAHDFLIAHIFKMRKSLTLISVDPLMGTGNYSATSNNMKLVHWPLISGLLHLVQYGGDWVGPQPDQSPPRCTKCNSPPIHGQCTNHRIAV